LSALTWLSSNYWVFLVYTLSHLPYQWDFIRVTALRLALDKADSGQIMSTTVDWALVNDEEVVSSAVYEPISQPDQVRPIHLVKPFFALNQPCQG